LRDRNGFVCGHQEFRARDDGAALLLAEIIFDACADECAKYELRRGRQRINPPTGPIFEQRMAGRVSRDTQLNAIALEERLQQSSWAVARSRRLMARIDSLKKMTPEFRQVEGSAATH